MTGNGGLPSFFLTGAIPPGFERRRVVIPGGGQHAYVASEWRDALVVVVRGEVELRSLSGVGPTLGEGDLLCLDGLILSFLHNRSEEPAVLTAVRRTRRGSVASASEPSWTW